MRVKPEKREPLVIKPLKTEQRVALNFLLSSNPDSYEFLRKDEVMKLIESETELLVTTSKDPKRTVLTWLRTIARDVSGKQRCSISEKVLVSARNGINKAVEQILSIS